MRFNMEVIEMQLMSVAVGCHARNMTCAVNVPVLTNAVALREGEQLCLDVAQKAQANKRNVETWKTGAM